MRKMKRKTWETIGIVVICTALIVGILGGLVALFGEEKTTKEISPSFSIGGLTSQGKYLETKESIYTKELFECRGLTITPDFESQVSYQIFFYDAEGEFLEATSKLTGAFNQVPDTATHARMVITPMDDAEVKFYEIRGYVKQLEIIVSKNQKLPVADEPEIGDTGDEGSSDTEGSTGNEETNNNGSSTGGNNPSVDDNTSSDDDDSQDVVNLYSYYGMASINESGEFFQDDYSTTIEYGWSNPIDVSNVDMLKITIDEAYYEMSESFNGDSGYSHIIFGVFSSENGFVWHDLWKNPSPYIDSINERSDFVDIYFNTESIDKFFLGGAGENTIVSVHQYTNLYSYWGEGHLTVDYTLDDDQNYGYGPRMHWSNIIDVSSIEKLEVRIPLEFYESSLYPSTSFQIAYWSGDSDFFDDLLPFYDCTLLDRYGVAGNYAFLEFDVSECREFILAFETMDYVNDIVVKEI